MHNAAFAVAGIDAEYLLRPTPAEALPNVVATLRTGELAGTNVTVPHKTAVRSLVDEESTLVRSIGALNTIVRTGNSLRAENTDAAGFQFALGELGLIEGRSRRAVVLGAGGAARAVVHVLLVAGYTVKVLARNAVRATALVGQLYRTHPGASLATFPLTTEHLLGGAREADLVVNATPVGAAPGAEASLWPDGAPVPSHLTLIDIVAWPLETRLIAQARASGARAEGGLTMLVGQAAAAFELWTGQPAPVAVMRAAALASAVASIDTSTEPTLTSYR